MLVYQAAVLLLLLLVAALVRRNHRDYHRPPRHWLAAPPRVSLLVPARNETMNIEACLAGLLAQDYPSCEILVLDDGSTDDTARRVERLAEGDRRLRLLTGTPLPPAWAGKAHACAQLASAARGEWLCFLDADTRQSPDLLSRAVAAAIEAEADLLSTFPRQEIGSVGEAVAVPFIHWALFTLLPIGLVPRLPSPALVAACGQFLLVRREAYAAAGGHAAIRHTLHDGLHLARGVKAAGGRVTLVDLSPQIACRMYRGWRECWRGFTRNAYQAFGSLPVLGLVTLIELALFVGPWVSLGIAIAGRPPWGGLAVAQVILLLAIQLGLRRRFAYPAATVFLLPLSLAAQVAIQWRSAWLALRRAPVVWKGRKTAR